MEIIRIITGALETNTYLIVGNENKAVLVDPGDDAPLIFERANSIGANIEAILLTHAHFDHCNAVSEIVGKTNARVYMHRDDKILLETDYNLASMLGLRFNNFAVDCFLRDGDELKLCGLDFKVLHTPGHTSGSCCYLVENCIFSGDTLFHLSRGRTDFPTSSSTQMLQSLSRLYSIVGDYTVYPGHGEGTLLSYERRYNRV